METSGSEQPTHNWPDDLMDIVQEPMGQTLDRMKKFSSSMNQVSQAEGQASTSRNIGSVLIRRGLVQPFRLRPNTVSLSFVFCHSRSHTYTPAIVAPFQSKNLC